MLPRITSYELAVLRRMAGKQQHLPAYTPIGTITDILRENGYVSYRYPRRLTKKAVNYLQEMKEHSI